MRLHKYIVLLALLFLSNAGCNLSETNIDPTQISAVELAELLPVAITQSAYNAGATIARSSGIIMQHWDLGDISAYTIDRYNSGHRAFNNYWQWGAYTGLLKSANTIINLAQKENQPQYAAVAKILMAKELGLLTSSFGDVPYSQALNIKILQAPYDTQEDVYASIQQLLDEAIVILEQPALGPLAGDLIFAGDMAKWRQTAHALKARYYMHLTKRDINAPVKALQEIDLAFKDNSSQPNFYFGPEIEAASPLAKFGDERPSTMVIHSTLYTVMNDNADPRIPKYMYFQGGYFPWLYYEEGQGLFWTENDSPLPLISLTELKFLAAEALLISGDQVSAEASMKEAVQANMSYLGVDPVLAANYIAALVNFAGLTTQEEMLEKIIGEKYLSLYAQGAIEIWVDYRRTGYPALTPHPYGENDLNPGGQIPRRFVYVENEYTTNKANVEAAANNIGGDLLSTKLWAFK